MAISRQQWMSIHLNGLGLRSGANAEDLGKASYAMAYGNAFAVPDDFDDRLTNTIAQILAFDGASQRTLIIVTGVYPSGEAYGGKEATFPKCSSAPRGSHASTDIADLGQEGLIGWVLDQLPK